MIDERSAYWRSFNDPSIPFELNWDDEREFSHFTKQMLVGIVRLTDDDARIEVDLLHHDLPFFIGITRHERAGWIADQMWKIFHNDNEDLFFELDHILDVGGAALRELLRLNLVEVFTDDGLIFLRVVDYGQAVSLIDERTVVPDAMGRYRSKAAAFAKLKTSKYADYLASDVWRRRRVRHLEYAGARCQLCNSDSQPLHVHHRTYERRGYESAADLIVLCKGCHALFHENGRLAK